MKGANESNDRCSDELLCSTSPLLLVSHPERTAQINIKLY
jgi:hypothetical protein